MRCKSCFGIFSQPSPDTKRTQTCAVCRGVIKTRTKNKEICEKTTKITLNREVEPKITSYLLKNNQGFIAKNTLHTISVGMVVRK